MRVYLDDTRTAPEGWVQARWPEEVIELLKTGQVEALSLDHDLGAEGPEADFRTGYAVLSWPGTCVGRMRRDYGRWLETMHSHLFFQPRMEQAIRAIQAIAKTS
jgi:hypothetical protein